MSHNAIAHRVAQGRLVIVGEGVFAVAPVLGYDDLGSWMGATLTAPGSRLSLGWAGFAWGFWYRPGGPVTVTRPGNGGPRRMSGVVAYRSTVVDEESTELHGIPITTVPRTLLDLARRSSWKALARGVRDAVRVELTTVPELFDFVAARVRRRGAKRLLKILAEYSGLPLQRARSGAEVRALQLLRAARRPAPELNVTIAGREADWSGPISSSLSRLTARPTTKTSGRTHARKRYGEPLGGLFAASSRITSTTNRTASLPWPP